MKSKQKNSATLTVAWTYAALAVTPNLSTGF